MNKFLRSRHTAAVAVTVAAATAAVLAVATPSFANEDATTYGSVTLRDCYHPSKQAYPSTSCTAIGTISGAVRLVCQYPGQSISGDSYWDYVLYGSSQGYVSDEYVKTQATAAPWRDYNVPICSY
ncbi:hypothetical protein [Streptomyces sp. IBSBF 2435]|uniref:hypothetical protein n=1 Tax=Streptomyces sp. IBSBF 2435 TaxID=2903531 RepID=UPI002FDBB687